MTEIEFLVSLLLTENLTEELKVKCLNRIADVEKARTNPFIPGLSTPGITLTPWMQPINTPNVQPLIVGQPLNVCQHEYENPWGSTTPPFCKKCGQQANPFTITCSTNGSVQNFLSVAK